jgi:hypothetical protein
MKIAIAALLVALFGLSGCEKAASTRTKPDPATTSMTKDETEMTPEELDEAYDRISDELAGYHDRVLAKHDSGRPMTGPEETVFHCLGFWHVANVNSADIFGYLNLVIGHEKHFEAIGAKGTLKAKEKLLPLYREMMAKPTEKEQMAFWHETRERRLEDEELAEGTVGFGQLLLDYALKHDSLIHPNPGTGK